MLEYSLEDVVCIKRESFTILNFSRDEHVAKILHYFIRKLVVSVELAF